MRGVTGGAVGDWILAEDGSGFRIPGNDVFDEFTGLVSEFGAYFSGEGFCEGTFSGFDF